LAVASGTHSVIITATESNSALLYSSTLNITVTGGGQVATFTGCVYNQTGNKYQAVRISLNQSATVTFDANLYYGTSCNPNQWADEFGFGSRTSLLLGAQSDNHPRLITGGFLFGQAGAEAPTF
jgi:hypothetical protein